MRLKAIKELAQAIFMSAAMVVGGAHGQEVNRHGRGTSILAIMELVEETIRISPKLQRAFLKYERKTGETSDSLFYGIAVQSLHVRGDGFAGLSNLDFARQYLDGAHPAVDKATDALFERWNANKSCPDCPPATA